MKEVFTVKDIMDGTGLSRQRIHALIKSRKIPVIRDNKQFLLKWQDLLKVANNPTILDFLKRNLENEKQQVDVSYKALREDAQGMMYAYILLMEKEFPTTEGKDLEWIKKFRKAYFYWWQMSGESGRHWSLEAYKYDFLDEGSTD